MSTTVEVKDGVITPKELPERFPCSGCAFSYTVGRGKGEYKGQMVIRKHNSRTGPGLCDGAQKPPKNDDVCACGGADPDCPNGCAVTPEEDLSSSPAHVHQYEYGDDGHDHSGSFCDCGKEEPSTAALEQDPVPSVAHLFKDLSGVEWSHPGGRDACVLPECVLARTAPVTDVQSVSATLPPADTFQSPGMAPAPPPPVSGQPEPDRDRWGRYLMPMENGGKSTGRTRATTFAKSTSDTFNLSQWGDRMVIRGLTLRPDLLALAHGLDVKQDRDMLNSIAEQAKEAAGNKVAANLGTALHAFSERLDAGLMQVSDVPAAYQAQMQMYVDTVRLCALTSRPEWIERTTGVTVQGTRPGVSEDVGGMLDRIFQLTDGSLVIGDLKTGADLTYGWGEIAVQLALYAHGVNQRGLFDWRTKTWGTPGAVRTDFAIVMHLPADPTEGGKYPDRGPSCELYWVDLKEGWEAASLNADVRAWRKTKNLARPLQREDIGNAPAAPVAPVIAQANEALENARQAQARWDNAEKHFRSATSREALAQLWQYATDCGHFSPDQVQRLTDIGMAQLNLLEPSPS